MKIAIVQQSSRLEDQQWDGDLHPMLMFNYMSKMKSIKRAFCKIQTKAMAELS